MYIYIFFLKDRDFIIDVDDLDDNFTFRAVNYKISAKVRMHILFHKW